MPKSRSILGIDLRVTSVKIVEIEKDKGRPIIKNWGLADLAYSLLNKHPDKEDAQADTIRKLVQEKKMKAKEAAVALGGSEVFVKIFNLSEVARGEMHEAVKWKLAEELPYPIEEAVFDYYPLSTTVGGAEQKADYLVASVNKNTYENYDRLIKRAGLKLAAMVILPDVLHEVFEVEILKNKGKIISLIYMGKNTTNISILKDNKIVFERELNIGGENITLAMSGVLVSPDGRIEISPDDAEKIKLEHGVPIDVATYPRVADIPITQLQAMVRPALERMQDEIMRSFEYYKGQTGEAAVDKILLTGGGSITKNLVKFLSDGLGIPVETPKILEGIEGSVDIEDRELLEEIIPRLSAAVGAGIAGGEKINLMPDEIKHRWELAAQELLKPQYVILTYTIFLFLFYMIFFVHALILDGVLSNINRKLKEYKPKIEALGLIEKTAKAHERKRLALQLHEEERTKIPLVFREISHLVPRSVILRNINMTPSEIHVWGTAFEVGDTAENVLSKFVLSLSSSKYFGEVKLLQASKNVEFVQDAFDFEIVAKIKI
ncbi:MAG: pilus assembly protein PilM [Candidatus Margulisiibacteriota bacterium]|nr:pilus assembly protein PilM [Candidatus Margulisiibacteriota bacterium]